MASHGGRLGRNPTAREIRSGPRGRARFGNPLPGSGNNPTVPLAPSKERRPKVSSPDREELLGNSQPQPRGTDRALSKALRRTGSVNVAVPPYISLFTGCGGLDLAVGLAVPSSRCVCRVENDAAVARILAARMEEGSLEPSPIWSDVRTFDGKRWRDQVDGIVGGCGDSGRGGTYRTYSAGE